MTGKDSAGLSVMRRVLARLGAGVACLLLQGCLAQEADLRHVRSDLNTSIRQSQREKEEIHRAVEQANLLIAQQKKEADELVRETRARLSNEVARLREVSLPQIRGELEKSDNRTGRLVQGLEDVNQRFTSLERTQKSQSEQIATLKLERDRLQEELGKLVSRADTLGQSLVGAVKGMEAKLQEQQKELQATSAQTVTLAKRLDVQPQTLIGQLGEFRSALAEFKTVLASLGEQVAQQDQRLNHLSQLGVELSQRTEAVKAKLEEDDKTVSAHLARVNKSVESVALALKTSSEGLAARVDNMERRQVEIAQQTASLQGKAESITGRVNQVQQVPPNVRKTREGPAPTRRQASEGELLQSAIRPGQNSLIETDKEAYDRAMQRFKTGDLESAREGFRGFLVRYPNSQLAPNAQYWIGECYYGTKDFQRAIEAYNRVKAVYPGSNKVPSALLKKGFAYLSLNDRAQASSVLKQVVEGFPQSHEASMARDKLAQLKQGR